MNGEEIGSATIAVVEKIDEMVESGNLSTREGQSMLITVFREGMVTMGSISKRMIELETAYVRFVNTASAGKTLEEENKKTLQEIVPTFKAVKWVGTILIGSIVLLLWQIFTGQVTISFR